MRKVIFWFITILLIWTLGSVGLTQVLPSLTESTPAPTPSPTNIASPPVTPPATSVAVSLPNTYSYADHDCSFKFSYPETWEPYDEIDSSGTYKAEIDLFEGDFIIADLAVYVENYESSLASYAISVEEWMMDPQNMPEYSKISEEAVTIGGLPAIKRFYTWTKIKQEDNTKIPIKAVDVYLVKDNKGYILEGQTVKEKFEQILPQLEAIINSFTISGVITEQAPPADVNSVVSTTEAPSSTISPNNNTTNGEIAFKFCPYCGTPLQPDYKFCPGCGRPIEVQRSAISPQKQKIGVRKGNKTNINLPENLIQTRGFLKELNQDDYQRGMNKNYSKPFNSFQPAFISQSFGSQLVRIFPQKPILPYAVSRRIISDYYDYGKVFPGSLGRKISSQVIVSRSLFPENMKFSYLKGLGKQIAFNSNSGTIFRGGEIDQLGSSLKELTGSIASPMMISRVPLSVGNWTLRSAKRGVKEDISMGSSMKRLTSKIGISSSKTTRSSSLLGGNLSTLGQGITCKVGVKREAETLPSLAPPTSQTEQTLPQVPPPTGPEGIVSPTPGVPAQGGITLTPPGQPVPSQPGPGGITLPTPGVPQQPEIIWKQYSLNQAFGHNPIITGYLEYPSTWLVNLDSFNRNVTFSEDASGLTALTLFPGLMGQFSSAQDLAQQMTYLLQQQVPDLSILNQEFKIVPTTGGGAIEVTEGKVQLQGSYQGTTFQFNMETYAIYTGVYGPSSSMGYVILTQAPQNIFVEKEQKYFNRMILSYKRALGVAK